MDVLRGRSQELSVATAAMHRVARLGQHAVVVVTGEAGIGKTAILQAIGVEAARLGFRVGTSKADEIGRISPAAPLLLAFRSGSDPLLGGPDFAALAALTDRPLLLVEELSTHLEDIASRTPVLIEIDDMHWADRLSIFALRTLLSRLAGIPVMWALATREDSSKFVADLVVPGLIEWSATTIEIGPLGTADIAAIAQDRLGRIPSEGARRMLERVGGNAFLATQIIDGIDRARARGEPEDRLPTEFIVSVRRAVADLEPGASELVRAAAVLGRPFAVDEVVGLMPDSPAAAVMAWVDSAVQCGLLSNVGHSLAFRHDLLRETIYADLAPQTRRMLHARCAGYLMAEGHSPLTAAPHLRAGAGRGDEESAALLCRAADEAVGAMPETAGELAMEALALVRPSQPSWPAIGEVCVDILSRVQRSADAVKIADAVLLHTGDPDRAARIQVLASRSLWLMGRPEDISGRVDAALSLDGIDPVLRAQLTAAKALGMTRTETAELAARTAEAALTEGLRRGDQLTEVLARQALGEVATNEVRHEVALQQFHMLRLRVGPGYLAQEVAALRMRDRFDEADELLASARSTAAEGAEAVLPSLVVAQMWHDFLLSRFDEAEAEAHTVVELGAELGNYVHDLDASMLLTELAVIRGDLVAARERLGHALRSDKGDDSVRAPRLLLLRGWIEAAEGDAKRSAATLTSLMSSASRTRSYWPRLPDWMRVHAGIARDAGDAAFARAAVDRAALGAERNPNVATFEGLALQVKGFVEDDVELLGQAVDVLGRSPRPYLLPGALADHGNLLLATGQRARGIMELSAALDTYERLGAGLQAAAVQTSMRGAGVRPKKGTEHRRPVTGWASLTKAELRVAELISDGRTNRSAARELGLSPHTVGTHLRAVFTKIDVQSRVQLTNALHARTREDRRFLDP